MEEIILRKLIIKLVKIAIPIIAIIVLGFIILFQGMREQYAELLRRAEDDQQNALSSLSDEVEGYRDAVYQMAKEYGIEDYTNHLLAIMQESTGGKGTDIMNAGGFESNLLYTNKRGMILDPYYSIQCGIQEFKALLELLGVDNPYESEKLLIVYQSYHYERAYIAYAQEAGGYTVDNATAYRAMNFMDRSLKPEFADNVAFILVMLEDAVGEFIYPLLNYRTISSYFGYRHSPTTGNYELHTGVDFPAPAGTPVLASASGKVVTANWNGGYGNCVIIEHSATYRTLYAHNSSLLVSVGDYVQQGQEIALVGSTGNSTGNHCHFEIRVNGTAEDPIPYLNQEIFIEN